MDDSELWDTLQRVNKTYGLNIQVISHGGDCYTITNEEYTGNMNEILSFIYGAQYVVSTLINK